MNTQILTPEIVDTAVVDEAIKAQPQQVKVTLQELKQTSKSKSAQKTKSSPPAKPHHPQKQAQTTSKPKAQSQQASTPRKQKQAPAAPKQEQQQKKQTPKFFPAKEKKQ